MGHCFNIFTLKLDYHSNSALIYALRFIFHVYSVNIFPPHLSQPFVCTLNLSWRL